MGNKMEFISGHKSTERIPVIIVPNLLKVYFGALVTLPTQANLFDEGEVPSPFL